MTRFTLGGSALESQTTSEYMELIKSRRPAERGFEFHKSVRDATDAEDLTYRLIAQNQDLVVVVGTASEQGFVPEQFYQTYAAGNSAHLRLRKEGAVGFARITSETLLSGGLVYCLYVPWLSKNQTGIDLGLTECKDG